MLAPPQPPASVSVVISPESDSDIWVTWSDPRPANYFSPITAVEIQLKQNRLFDSWKTYETLQLSDNPFKEAAASHPQQIDFDDGEMTDVENDDDFEERKAVEVACMAGSSTLEKRKEVFKSGNELALHCVLTGLAAKQGYQVRVRCANKYGWGDYDNGVSFTPNSGS